MNYVDGILIPVSNANKEAYRESAHKMALLFKEYGALNVVDCWGDDVPEGKLTSYTMAVKREDDESVVFSWISWPSRAFRDEAWKKVMADPRMQSGASPMPFDGKRMIYGGFEVISNV